MFGCFFSSITMMVPSLDVENTFYQVVLEGDVFMGQQPRYGDINSFHYVCKFEKYLYGLKQAPIAWYYRLSLKL